MAALRDGKFSRRFSVPQTTPLAPIWKYLGTHLSHQRHQSATTGDLQLAEDGMKMFFHRFETQAAFVGNLLIAAPIAH